MFSKKPVSVFLATTKEEDCLAFYTKAMGLPLKDNGPYALVFDLNGAELRISKVKSFTPHPFTVMDWQVDDLDAAMSHLLDNGVVFEIFDGFGQDENGVWTVPEGQTKIAWFKDPDANLLSISLRID